MPKLILFKKIILITILSFFLSLKSGFSINYEYNWVGQVIFLNEDNVQETSTGCSGSLIGRDLILTAAHCVIDLETGILRQPSKLYFTLDEVDYFSVRGIRTTDYMNAEKKCDGLPDYKKLDCLESESVKDWAILQINYTFPEHWGYFKLSNFENYFSHTKIKNRYAELKGSVAGFSSGELKLQHGVSIGNDLGYFDTIYIKTKLYFGDSGGPVWVNLPGEDPTIIGVLSCILYDGTISEDKIRENSIAMATSSGYLEAYKKLKEEY